MPKQFARMFCAVITVLWVVGAVAENDGHMHQHLPKDIDAFHSLIAPIWHARPGKERSRNTCAKVTELKKGAEDIRSTDATSLVIAIAALKSKCEGHFNDVDAALFDVHEAFHSIIDSKPPESTS